LRLFLIGFDFGNVGLVIRCKVCDFQKAICAAGFDDECGRARRNIIASDRFARFQNPSARRGHH